VLGHTLRLFHPFLPFITEDLWHGLGYSADLPPDQGGRTIMTARWPQPLDADFKDFYGLDDCYEEAVEAKFELVRQGRNLRRLFNLPAAQKLDFILRPAEGVSPHEAEYLKLLLNAGTLTVDPEYTAPQGTPQASNAVGTLHLPLVGLIDPAAERARLGKELEKIRAEVTKVQEKLGHPNFTQKAPPAVLAEHQQRLADWQAKAAQVEEALKSLGV
ncbi:MAG: class I tRNA ligase family protein, partial [Limisphaerales bacterium]